LLQEFTEEEVVVAHPDYADHFIDERTKIIRVHTMDPVGLGPVTMMYTNGRTATSLVELFSAVMSMPVTHMNPTHGSISIPAGYPESIQKLSQIVRAGPDNWIGIQAGIESASDRLAQLHMPLKTMPLKIGADGTFAEIIAEGTANLNKYYWRPAFTLQIGQAEETPEDNWSTVGLINDMSEAGLEFTATVLYNVPLGLLKSRRTFSYDIYDKFDEAQMAVVYASFRHLLKMTQRRAYSLAKGNVMSSIAVGAVLHGGAALVLRVLERMFVKKGLDPEKVKRYTLNLFN